MTPDGALSMSVVNWSNGPKEAPCGGQPDSRTCPSYGPARRCDDMAHCLTVRGLVCVADITAIWPHPVSVIKVCIQMEKKRFDNQHKNISTVLTVLVLERYHRHHHHHNGTVQ